MVPFLVLIPDSELSLGLYTCSWVTVCPVLITFNNSFFLFANPVFTSRINSREKRAKHATSDRASGQRNIEELRRRTFGRWLTLRLHAYCPNAGR
jgi:hypothetical protein